MNHRSVWLIGALSVLTGCAAAAVLIVFAARSARAAPGILYVAPGGACGGASPCYGGVQAAVDAALPGDEIRVAAGSYSGVNDRGGLSQVVSITKTLTLRGGYTTTDWDTADPLANPTHLNAMVQGRVVYIAGENITVTLDGLRLSYGNANGLGGGPSGADAGGGIYVSDAAVTIQNSWVLSSTTPSSGAGGGIYMVDTIAAVNDSFIQGNFSGSGAGMYLYRANALVAANQILDNQVTFQIGKGNGLYVVSSQATIRGNTLRGNSNAINTYSAALSVRYGDVLITGNLVEANPSSGGIEGSSETIPAPLILDGNTIQGNNGRGVMVTGGVYLTMTNNVVAYNDSRGVVIDYGAYPASAFVGWNWIHHNVSHGWGDCGGGLMASPGVDYPMVVVGNVIQDNKNGVDSASGGSGGGVCVDGNTVTLIGNVIQRNHANNVMTVHGYGGGIYLTGDATLINNVVTDNTSVLEGGGIAIRGASPTLYHTTVANNGGIGIYVGEGSGDQPAQPELYNSLIAGHATGVYVSGAVLNVARVEGVLWWNNTVNKGGSGTAFLLSEQSGDPAFVDPANGEYHIGPASQAIDGGIATSVKHDIDLEPRLLLPADLGADEYWAPGALKRIYLPVLMR